MGSEEFALLEAGLPETVWTPGPWLDELQLWWDKTQPLGVFMSGEGGSRVAEVIRDLGYYPGPRQVIALDLSGGQVVLAGQGNDGLMAGFMNSSLRKFVDCLAGFDSLLPLFSDEDLQAALDSSSFDPRPEAVRRVTAMLAEVDPPAIDGSWDYYIDSIWYGDLGSESSLEEWNKSD
jgi:hypothetical protein